MLRLLLAMMISSVLYATSATFTSCTAGTTTLNPCPGNAFLSTGLSGPNFFVSAFAATGETAGQPGFSTLAETTASYTGPPPPALPPLSATASASDDISAHTAGPSRLGLIQFTMSEGPTTSHGGSGSVTITDGVHTYVPVCTHPVIFCTYTATLPFDLGTDFQILESANAGTSIAPGGVVGSGQGGLADISFTLFESNGETPVAYYIAPEPSTFSLLFLAAAGGWLLLKCRVSPGTFRSLQACRRQVHQRGVVAGAGGFIERVR